DLSQSQLSVAHISDSGLSLIEPERITATHVVISVYSLSKFGLMMWKRLRKHKKISGQVLLFCTPQKHKINMFLLPRNISVDQVAVKQRSTTHYIDAPSKCKLVIDRHYTAVCPRAKVQPERELFDMDNEPNFHPSFELRLSSESGKMSISVREESHGEESEAEVWRHELDLSEFSVSTDSSPQSDARTQLKSLRTTFVNNVNDPLLKGLLDRLQDEKVLNPEEAANVQVQSTTQDKARHVIDTVLKKGDRAASVLVRAYSSFCPTAEDVLVSHSLHTSLSRRRPSVPQPPNVPQLKTSRCPTASKRPSAEDVLPPNVPQLKTSSCPTASKPSKRPSAEDVRCPTASKRPSAEDPRRVALSRLKGNSRRSAAHRSGSFVGKAPGPLLPPSGPRPALYKYHVQLFTRTLSGPTHAPCHSTLGRSPLRGKCFTGRKLEVRGDCDNFQDRGFMNRVNSIRVESGAWICYDHPDFKGQQYILEHGEYPEFQRWNSHNDHMGSCKPIRMHGEHYRIEMFEGCNFSGQCVEICDDCPFCRARLLQELHQLCARLRRRRLGDVRGAQLPRPHVQSGPCSLSFSPPPRCTLTRSPRSHGPCRPETFAARRLFHLSRLSAPAGLCLNLHTAASPLRMGASVEQFEEAKSKLSSLQKDPGNEAKLKIYALFKQSTLGPCSTARPGMLDFVNRAKWDAWNALGNVSKEDARQQYCDLIGSLVAAEGGSVAAKPAGSLSSEYQTLLVTTEENITTIKLNRPAKKNAITTEMYNEIIAALEHASKDSSVLTVFTGAGDFYCSGNDLTNFTNIPDGGVQQMAQKGGELLRRYIRSYIDFPKPLVAVVNGPAVGVSVTVLGLFDLVYATERTQHQQTPKQADYDALDANSLDASRRQTLELQVVQVKRWSFRWCRSNAGASGGAGQTLELQVVAGQTLELQVVQVKRWELQVVQVKRWSFRWCRSNAGASGGAGQTLELQVVQVKRWSFRWCRSNAGASGGAGQTLELQVVQVKRWSFRWCRSNAGASGGAGQTARWLRAGVAGASPHD
ncbi:hypothetical protein WMY93_032979, partial [Mugilogobius chulae]